MSALQIERMKDIKEEVEQWKTSNIQVFWSEIAHGDHLLQIYENDKVFLDTLEGFAGSGFLAGDSVIVIATSSHLGLLHQRLQKQGFDLDHLIETQRYIGLNAEDQFSKFMINNSPDEKLFFDFVYHLLNSVKKDGRKVLVFGELVAMLLEQHNYNATVQLEDLWHQLVHKNSFTLYCAYPKSGLKQNASESIARICESHHTLIDGKPRPSTEICYRAAV